MANLLAYGNDVLGGSGGSGVGHIIQDNTGTDLTQRDRLQVTGYISATDDPTHEKTILKDVETVTWTVWQTMTTQQKQGKHWLITDAPETILEDQAIFSILNEELEFTNLVATVSDMRIGANDAVLVYFSNDTVASDAGIVVTWSDGVVTFTAATTPASTLTANIFCIKPALASPRENIDADDVSYSTGTVKTVLDAMPTTYAKKGDVIEYNKINWDWTDDNSVYYILKWISDDFTGGILNPDILVGTYSFCDYCNIIAGDSIFVLYKTLNGVTGLFFDGDEIFFVQFGQDATIYAYDEPDWAQIAEDEGITEEQARFNFLDDNILYCRKISYLEFDTDQITLRANGWQGNSAPYTLTQSVRGWIDGIPTFELVVSDDITTGKSQIENWNKITKTSVNHGNITFYCYDEKPSIDLTVKVQYFLDNT